MNENPYIAPSADVSTEPVYAGFWIRIGAFIIDSILASIVIWPILYAIYGMSYFTPGHIVNTVSWGNLISWIFPAVAVITFWIYISATPGKKFLHLKIVDAESGKKPTNGQFIGRYFGYYVSTLPLFLGLIWVGIDKRKQGFHDKLAGTLVVRE